jgi:hypothetical protein
MEKVRQAILQFDATVHLQDPSAVLLCFVLASSIVGPDAERLAAMCEIPPSLAANWAANLRRNGVWKGDKVDCVPWYETKRGVSSFLVKQYRRGTSSKSRPMARNSTKSRSNKTPS